MITTLDYLFDANEQEKSDYLKEQKEIYLDAITKYVGDNEPNSNLFYWENNFIVLHLIRYSRRLVGAKNFEYYFFAEKSNIQKDSMVTHDFSDDENTKIIQTTTSRESSGNVALLLSNNATNIDIENILKNSIQTPFIKAETFSITWIEEEYRNSTKSLKLIPVNIENFNTIKFHIDRYSFSSLINTINNKQFSLELEDCLFAYENERWFLCGAGLGSLIEELLYLTNKNFDNEMKGFPKSPTFSDYMKSLKEHFEIDRRNETYLRTQFDNRNSISHYNDGFTSKEQCDSLLQLLKNIFNNYYLKSLEK